MIQSISTTEPDPESTSDSLVESVNCTSTCTKARGTETSSPSERKSAVLIDRCVDLLHCVRSSGSADDICNKLGRLLPQLERNLVLQSKLKTRHFIEDFDAIGWFFPGLSLVKTDKKARNYSMLARVFMLQTLASMQQLYVNVSYDHYKNDRM